MHRRSFIKHTTLLGSGLLIGNEVLADLIADEVIKIAMIGCGDRGKGVLSVIKSMPGKYKTVAYCDVLDFRLKETEKYVPDDAKPIKDYHQVLDE